MPLLQANGIDVFYDEVGSRKAPALLLITGLGTQMIGWPEAFCGRLSDRRLSRIIRFDNRDIGLSTKIENGAEDRRPGRLPARARRPARRRAVQPRRYGP